MNSDDTYMYIYIYINICMYITYQDPLFAVSVEGPLEVKTPLVGPGI